MILKLYFYTYGFNEDKFAALHNSPHFRNDIIHARFLPISYMVIRNFKYKLEIRMRIIWFWSILLQNDHKYILELTTARRRLMLYTRLFSPRVFFFAVVSPRLHNSKLREILIKTAIHSL